MKKVSVYIGSRANYSSAISILKSVKNSKKLELSIVIGGAGVIPRYGDIRRLLHQQGFKKYFVANTLVEGETPVTMSKSVGLGITEFSSILDLIKPDYVIAIGDRFDVLPWVISAAMMNICVAHTMGGERSGTIDESIRHSITKFSNIHFPANKDAKNRIIKMGENKKDVHAVGCPRIDYVLDTLAEIKKGNFISSRSLFKIYKGAGPIFSLEKSKFLLVLFHPVTTEYGSNKKHIDAILSALNEMKMNTILIWPNADAGSDEISKGIRIFREKYNPSWLHLFINLPLKIYVQLMYQCSCLIGNSSSAIREGEVIGVPSVNIGTRQNMRLMGNNILNCKPEKNAVLQAINTQIKVGKFKTKYLYGKGDAGRKIASILENHKLGSTQKIITY